MVQHPRTSDFWSRALGLDSQLEIWSAGVVPAGLASWSLKNLGKLGRPCMAERVGTKGAT